MIKILNYIEFLYLELISRYYYSSRYFYQKFFRERYQKKAKEVIYKDHNDLYHLLKNMIFKFNFDYKHSMTFWGDALFLLNFYLTLKPKLTLEFGSGTSSVVFCYGAKILNKNFGKNYKIISIDENEKYLNNIVIPGIPNDYKQYIDLIYSETDIKFYNNDLGIHYKKKPIVNIDLVYVDGPQFNKGVYDKSKHKYNENLLKKLKSKPFDSDTIEILEKNKGLVVVIDQRISTVWKLIKYTKNKIINKKYYFSAKKTVIKYN